MASCLIGYYLYRYYLYLRALVIPIYFLSFKHVESFANSPCCNANVYNVSPT